MVTAGCGGDGIAVTVPGGVASPEGPLFSSAMARGGEDAGQPSVRRLKVESAQQRADQGRWGSLLQFGRAMCGCRRSSRSQAPSHSPDQQESTSST